MPRGFSVPGIGFSHGSGTGSQPGDRHNTDGAGHFFTREQALRGAEAGLGEIGVNAFYQALDQCGTPGQRALIEDIGMEEFIEATHLSANGSDGGEYLFGLTDHPDAIRIILDNAISYIDGHF